MKEIFFYRINLGQKKLNFLKKYIDKLNNLI